MFFICAAALLKQTSEMAHQGKIICNKKTGQQIEFIRTAKDTKGKLLEMESVFRPVSIEPVPHYHPFQEEIFTILEGTISVRLKNEVKILRKGDQLHIKRNEVHSMWNHSNEETKVNWRVMPALDTEYFLENGIAIANNKKTNEQGLPGLLQASLLANKFSHVFRIAKPPYPVQKIIFPVLGAIALMAGYRSEYKEFAD